MVKMKIEYDAIFWADSFIKKIIIEYDRISVDVFNDLLQKSILIECRNCIGISKFIFVNEIILENIFLNNISAKSNQMYIDVFDEYRNKAYEAEETLESPICELRFLLANGTDFSILCQEVMFNTFGE